MTILSVVKYITNCSSYAEVNRIEELHNKVITLLRDKRDLDTDINIDKSDKDIDINTEDKSDKDIDLNTNNRI